jgi:type IV pilus assembly protein PilY1
MINKNSGKHYRRGKIVAAVIAATSWVTTPVWADDTEIFFGDLRGGGSAPNVLFILDTSGSMGNEDGTGRARIDRVKDAIKQLVGDLNDVNVGLMRFSNPGGPVLYPVTYIDQATGHNGADVSVTATVNSGLDDASEILSSGAVSLANADLRMGRIQTSINSVETTIRATIDQPDHDAAQATSGTNYTSDQDLSGAPRALMLSDSPYDSIGFRFGGLEIPPGATILSANLEVTVKDAAGAMSVGIVGITANAAAFMDRPTRPFKNEANNISDRAPWATYAIHWNMLDGAGALPLADSTLTSPDLKDLVQQIVDTPQWEGDQGHEDDVVLILKPAAGNSTNFRSLYSVEMDATRSAKLNIRYATDQPVNEDFISGVRVTGVNVPQNVTVTSAVLEFEADLSDPTNANLSVAIESADDPVPFSASNGDISGRSTGTPAVWNSSNTEWTSGSAVQVDVTSLVNSHVQRSGWCGGDNMAFVINGNAGSRIAKSHDSGSANAPKLLVTYDKGTLLPGNSCRSLTLTKRIINDKDDGQSSGAGAAVGTAGDTIAVSNDNFALLRFTDLNIPDNADIQSAYIKVFAGADNSDATGLSVSIESTASAEPIGNGGGVASRQFIGNVPWDIPAGTNWATGSAYVSPDISGLIRSALGNNWSTGNDMMLQISRTSGAGRTLYGHDFNTQTQAAQLIINFIDDGTQGANTVREEMIEVVDSLTDAGFTPVQDTFYEAWQYYTGGDVVWGKYRGGLNANGTEINDGSPASNGPFHYTRVSAEAALKSGTFSGRVLPPGCPSTNSSDSNCNDANGAGQPKGEYLLGSPEYESPITSYCQAESHIIMLTDGIANEPHSESYIKGIDGISSCANTSTDNSTNRAQMCVLELAERMQGDVSSLTGNQKITTHTIGFNFSSNWLQDIATRGGGAYKEADDAASLVAEIEAILSDVLKTDTSFVAPVAAINQFNRLTNLDEVYFAVFRPDEVPRWPGNLKKYKLAKVGNENNVLIDATATPAVSPATGFFKPDSRSLWSAVEDGSSVDLGGAASKFPAVVSRKIYTNLGLSNTLTAASNLVTVNNSDLTATDLGVADADRDAQIEWIRGKDVDDEDGDGDVTEQRYIMSDPLHSKPVAVTYGSPTDPAPDVTIFMGTNAGFIHAIDADSGAEDFSFIPKDLLGKQVPLRNNNAARNHVYGIDGSIAVWSKDAGNNGIVPGTADFVRLYFGQRRGGRSYYALDTTNRANPQMMWQITGGSTTGFEEMGQTWGRPVAGKILLSGSATPRDVLFISGGYDPDKDTYNTRLPDDEGRAIYIVDSLTGALIWSGGTDQGGSFTKLFAQMNYSFPSSLSVADTDSDGLDDVMFIGDTGGQLWRFDIKKNVAAADLVSGGVIASVATGGELDPVKNRMFYHAPDVAMVEIDGSRELAITIGSGKRPNPLSKDTQDRIYMIRQKSVFGAPSSYQNLLQSDLYNAADNLVQQGTAAEQAAAYTALSAAGGWYFDLPREGEKVLSTPLTFRNTVTFTTYEPNSSSDSCVPKAGTSRVYQLNIGDASSVNNWDNIDGLTAEDRSYELSTPSIIDEPVIICTGDGCDLFTGAEKPPVDTLSSGSIINTFWRQDQ